MERWLHAPARAAIVRSKSWFVPGDGPSPSSSDKQVEIPLAPPSEDWRHLKISSRHARNFSLPESCRMVLEARHTVSMSKTEPKIVRKLETCVLEHCSVVSIGDCIYTFEYGDHFLTDAFLIQMSEFFEGNGMQQWSPNKHITPASIGQPICFGAYSCSPSAFDRGANGEIYTRWAPDGRPVVIKSLKIPKRLQFERQNLIMQYIGYHIRSSRSSALLKRSS